MARRDLVWQGSAGRDKASKSRHRKVWFGESRQAWLGLVCRAKVWPGQAGMAWWGTARHGKARLGLAGEAERVMSRHGMAWSGRQGMSRQGASWFGEASPPEAPCVGEAARTGNHGNGRGIVFLDKVTAWWPWGQCPVDRHQSDRRCHLVQGETRRSMRSLQLDYGQGQRPVQPQHFELANFYGEGNPQSKR